MTASQTEATSRIHAWLGARSAWQRRGVAFLAGAAATLGHAPFQLVPVYVAAIVVLVWLLDGAAAKARAQGRASVAALRSAGGSASAT